jgi:nicotinamide riboside transporter PnuC
VYLSSYLRYAFWCAASQKARILLLNNGCGGSVVLRLDYVSCVLTIVSTILVGRRCWEGWVLAAINSIIICIIGFKTAQMGFIPANIFCLVLYTVNLRTWRRSEVSERTN